jgi:hypothetical protein
MAVEIGETNAITDQNGFLRARTARSRKGARIVAQAWSQAVC